MSELQLGLLAIGALLVAGVFAYNRRQERAAQRSAEATFRSGHADVLLEPQAARKDPSPAQKPPAAATAHGDSSAGALPDPRIDYIVELSFPAAQKAGVLCEQWKPNEHRFAGRALLACFGGGASWRSLDAADSLLIESLRAGLQLVTRHGAVNEGQLLEFRASVETLAAATGASIRAPEIRQAVETARDLEQFCEDADVHVVIHVAATAEGPLAAARADAAAAQAGFALEEDGRFALRDGEGNLLYALSASDGSRLEPGAPEGATLPGVSLALDVPRVADFPRVFRSMAVFATDLARSLGGTLIDDNRNTLDERALEAIAAQLESVRAQFEARGIASGSATTLRLFS